MVRPTAVEVATWLWVVMSVLSWLGVAGLDGAQDPQALPLDLLLIVPVLVLFVFGCMKFRAGVDGWRVFFTVLTVMHALSMLVTTILDPHQLSEGPVSAETSVSFCALAVAGLVLAWLPSSRRYFREVGQHKKMAKAQRMAAPYQAQTPYGYPQWGPQGRSPYGPSPQGQPPYDQPPYGQPPYGQPVQRQQPPRQ